MLPTKAPATRAWRCINTKALRQSIFTVASGDYRCGANSQGSLVGRETGERYFTPEVDSLTVGVESVNNPNMLCKDVLPKMSIGGRTWIDNTMAVI